MTRDFSVLRSAADQFSAVQRQRVAAGQRAVAIEQGRDDGTPDFWRKWEERWREMEDLALEELQAEAAFHPAYVELQKLSGIGPILAAEFLGIIGDFGRFDTISKLWAYAGLRPDQKMEKGVNINWSTRLKGLTGRMAVRLLMVGSAYRAIYDEAKADYQGRPEWTPLHIDLASRRKMVKILLAHMWILGRRAQGLPVSEPYAVAVLGHTGTRRPEEFFKAKPITA